jgi:hypothetical protein
MHESACKRGKLSIKENKTVLIQMQTQQQKHGTTTACDETIIGGEAAEKTQQLKIEQKRNTAFVAPIHEI